MQEYCTAVSFYQDTVLLKLNIIDLLLALEIKKQQRGCHGHDHMVVGFTIMQSLCLKYD
jgi:hypothetical protein